jgi:hypothetical protein
MRTAPGPSSQPEIGVGSVIRGFSVERVASRSTGLEVVFDATDRGGEPVSMVVARAPLAQGRGWGEFRRDARLRMSLRHPALLHVGAAGEFAGRPYLVTERHPEGTFADLVRRGTLEPAAALELLAPVCEALDLAHERGLVHRTLSSDSLLPGERGLRLDSFGIAGWPAQPTAESIDHRDARYASPEELAGRPLEPASNIYSLAFILAEAAGPERARAVEVLAHGMTGDPARRQPTATDLLHETAAALGVELSAPGDVERPPSRRVQPPRDEPLRRRRRRGPASALVVAAALALATLAGAVTAAIVNPFDDSGDAGLADSSVAPASDASADRSVLRRLDERRAELRADLASAETPAAQAEAADGLAAAYREAAGELQSRPLESAARSAEQAYVALAAAARSGDADRFAAASREVERTERAAATAVAPR